MPDFGKNIVQREPGLREDTDAWLTAIDPQNMVGLKISDYLLDTGRHHIEDGIYIDDVQKHIKAYYETMSGHDAENHRQIF